MQDETIRIEVPKDSFRRQIMLNIIQHQLGDQDVNFGNEYYINKGGGPITFNQKAIDRINSLVNNFPSSCHILPPNSINELLSEAYPTVVKLDSSTNLWYMIQNSTDNLYEIMEFLAKLKKQYRVYDDSDSQYNTVLRDVFGFECVVSKLCSSTVFVKIQPNIDFISDRDFPMVSCKFQTLSLSTDSIVRVPGAVGLLWIFYNFKEYFGDKVDLDLLSKIHYDPKLEIYVFPHASEKLTRQILDKSMIDSTIEYKSFLTADLAVDAHLGEYFGYQSLVLDKDVAWVKATVLSTDNKFQFLGSNEEDVITMQSFSELTGKSRGDVFLSDHKHNYINSELRSYFATPNDRGLIPHERVLPYDRDPCPFYNIISRLSSAGVLPYHNKRGLYNSSRPYICNDSEWATILTKLEWKIHRYPYYKSTTISRLNHEGAVQFEDFLDIAPVSHDIGSGYYLNVYSGEVYQPDAVLLTIVIKTGPKQFQKVFEFVDYSGLSDSDIAKAIRNGLINVMGVKYTLFGRVTPIFKFADEDSALNDYLASVMKKYINKDFKIS